MRRDELEHAIRAATQIIKDDRVIIIGSQAILGSYTEDQLPAAATMSPEVDIAPMSDTDAEALSDQLSFDAGEWSEFHAAYGFYIEGVGKRTAILPPDWEYRLVGVRSAATNNATGLCLDPHDLCAAKLMAHREKDFAFVQALVDARLIDPAILQQRLASIDLTEVQSDQDIDVLDYRQRHSIAWAAALPGNHCCEQQNAHLGPTPTIAPHWFEPFGTGLRVTTTRLRAPAGRILVGR